MERVETKVRRTKINQKSNRKPLKEKLGELAQFRKLLRTPGLFDEIKSSIHKGNHLLTTIKSSNSSFTDMGKV
jgi:hypothetical protein